MEEKKKHAQNLGVTTKWVTSLVSRLKEKVKCSDCCAIFTDTTALLTSCAARWPPQYAPAPPWLLTLKSVWESHVTWGTPVQSFVFLGLLVFELEPMYATSDRRTDGRMTDADDRLMPPPPLRGRGHNNNNIAFWFSDVVNVAHETGSKRWNIYGWNIIRD